jgi:hypothetical protein
MLKCQIKSEPYLPAGPEPSMVQGGQVCYQESHEASLMGPSKTTLTNNVIRKTM